MSFNFKTLRKATLLSIAALVALGGVAFAYDHSAIPLRDSDGNLIDVTATDNAYSPRGTCGECHDYDAIESHSYHAQLASNQHYGWNPMNPDGDTWEKGAGPKGKAWVQGQGHMGAW